MDVEAEIAELKRRMTALETEVKEDRKLSVRLFEYLREIREDVAVLRTHAMVTDGRLKRLEDRIDRVEAELAAIRSELNALRSEFNASRAEFNAFRKELPGMIADTMREVLREYRSR